MGSKTTREPGAGYKNDQGAEVSNLESMGSIKEIIQGARRKGKISKGAGSWGPPPLWGLIILVPSAKKLSHNPDYIRDHVLTLPYLCMIYCK